MIDLGDNHFATIVVFKDDTHAAIEVAHKTPSGADCLEFIAITDSAWSKEFKPGTITTWELLSKDPLTLSPSLLCGCGDHGFIQNGKWVKA